MFGPLTCTVVYCRIGLLQNVLHKEKVIDHEIHTLSPGRRGLWKFLALLIPPLWASAWPLLVFASSKIEPLDLNAAAAGQQDAFRVCE